MAAAIHLGAGAGGANPPGGGGANLVKHLHTKCSVCLLAPIVGSRFHCAVCFDLDLCGDCVKTHKKTHPVIEFAEPLHESWAQNAGSLPLMSLPSFLFGGQNKFTQRFDANIMGEFMNVFNGGILLAKPEVNNAATALLALAQQAKEKQWTLLQTDEKHLNYKYFRIRQIAKAMQVSGDTGTRDLQFYKPQFGTMVMVGADGTPLVALSLQVPIGTTSAFIPKKPSNVDYHWVGMYSYAEGFAHMVVTSLLPPDANLNLVIELWCVDDDGNTTVQIQPALTPSQTNMMNSSMLAGGDHFTYATPTQYGYSRFGLRVRATTAKARFYSTYWTSPDMITRSVASKKPGNFGGGIMGAGGGGVGIPIFPINGGVVGGGGVAHNPGAAAGGWGNGAQANNNNGANYNGLLTPLVIDLVHTPQLRSERIATLTQAILDRIERLKQASITGKLLDQYKFVPPVTTTCKACTNLNCDCRLLPCGCKCIHLEDAEPDVSTQAAPHSYIGSCPQCKRMVHSWIGVNGDNTATTLGNQAAGSQNNAALTASFKSSSRNVCLATKLDNTGFVDVDLV